MLMTRKMRNNSDKGIEVELKSPFPYSYFISLPLTFFLAILGAACFDALTIHFCLIAFLIIARVLCIFFALAANRIKVTQETVSIYFWVFPFWVWEKKIIDIQSLKFHPLFRLPFSELEFTIKKNNRLKKKGLTVCNSYHSLKPIFEELQSKGIAIINK